MAGDTPEAAFPDEDASAEELQPDSVAPLLDGIPGLTQRLATAKEQISRGEGIPLDDL